MGALVPSFMKKGRDSVFVARVCLAGLKNKGKIQIFKKGKRTEGGLWSRTVIAVMAKSKSPRFAVEITPKSWRKWDKRSGDGAERVQEATPSPQQLVECEPALGSAQ